MPKFALGLVYIEPEAAHKLRALGRTGEEFLSRHQEAEWGDQPRIAESSSRALARQSWVTPLLSFYKLVGNAGLMITTNPLRTHTAVTWRTVQR